MKEYSLGLENFLQFLKNAREVYNISKLKENDADNETQDILHKLELGNNSYHETATEGRYYNQKTDILEDHNIGG